MLGHLDSFLVAGRAVGLSPRTLRWYQLNLLAFARFCADRDWRQVDVIRAFLASLYARELSRETVRGYLRTLKRFFRWLVDEERVLHNPMDAVPMPRAARRVPRGIAPADFAALLASTSPGGDWCAVRDRALLLILRDTGCRVSEVAALRLIDLRLEDGLILVMGKGGQERFAFLSPLTVEALRAWLSARGAGGTSGDVGAMGQLFVSRRGAFKASTLYEMLKRTARRAGVTRHFNPHAFRHAFARDWLGAGGDLASLSQVLGHRDIATTMVYATMAVSDLQSKHTRFSPLRSPQT